MGEFVDMLLEGTAERLPSAPATGPALTRLRPSVQLLYLAQLNIHLDPAFERELARLVKLRRAPSKSEAVRIAVSEALAKSKRRASATDFRAWVGRAAAAPQNPTPRFRSDDDLWSTRQRLPIAPTV